MDLHQIISYPLYAGGILEIILGIALLKKAPPQGRAMRACAGLFFFAAAFVLFTAISYTLEAHGRDYSFFNRACWIGWFMIPAGLQFAYYMQDENSSAARFVAYVLYPFWGLVFILTMLTDLVEPGDPSLIPFVDIDGPLEKPVRIIGALMAIWLLVALYRAKNRMTGNRKAQFNLFFYGTLFFNLGCILIAGVLPLFGAINPAFTTFFSLPWVVITYYAITRHRFFDLRLLVSRVLNIAIPSVLFSALHIVLFKLWSPSLGDSLAILLSLAIIGLIFFGTRFSRTVQQRVQKLVLQDKYDYQSVLRESIKALVTILNQEELLAYLIHSIKKSMGVESICLALKMEGGRIAQLYGDGTLARATQDRPMSDTMIEWLRHANHVVVREELESTGPQGINHMMQAYMTELGAEIIVPLVYKGEIKGLIVLGQKGNGEPYLQSDIDLLESLAGHAAVAIENARLFDEARYSKESFLASEAKFRTLADTAAITIFIHQGGNFLYANRMAETWGYTVDEYLTMNFMSLVHPDYREMIKARARERLTGGQAPPQYEFKIVRKNGEERWVLMTAGVTNYEGKPSVIGTLIDITARKQAEEETEHLFKELASTAISLKESEARFRTLAETTTAAIFIHQGQKLVYANQAGEKLTGYPREELLQEDFWALIHPDYQELVKERGWARIRGEDVPQEYEFKVIRKNGEARWVAMTAGVIEFGEKPSIVATLFDITEWKRAEEAKIKFYEESVKQYQERIEEETRHRLEKEKILMDLHDGIGGITTNISILSELAQKTEDRDTIVKTLSTISKLSREGIAEIRSFMHSLDSKELNWRTLAVELRNQGTNMIAPHKIKFAIETDVDEDLHEQPGSLVWANMFKIYKEALTNVLKHSKATSVTVAFRARRNGVLLVIEDNGAGVRDGRVGGRGLSNMKARAVDIGGTVTIVAERGTRVSLELPVPLKYPAEGMAQ